jgi:allantoinase
MTPPRLTIKGGSLVTPDGVVSADLTSEEGVITAIGRAEGGGRVVDATGLVVLPGMVDTHVHLMDPGPTEREDFPTGTRAAAVSGVTTVVEHTHAHPVRSPSDLASKRAYLVGRSNVDYGLAAHVWPEDIAGMPELWRAGVVFFKLFTCTTHGVPGLSAPELLAALTALAAVDGRALVHCEDETMTAMAEWSLRRAGRHDPGLLVEWRSRRAELSALTMVGALAAATGVAITFAHVSHHEAVEVVQTARSWGADAAAEACPQYLALDESEVLDQGALRKFTPPARSRNDDERDQMWRALRNGSLTHVATDHAPSTVEQKLAGDIWEAPFGLPGLDTTYPFMVDAALRGVLTLDEVALRCAAVPAERYGLAPAKGAILVGADADLVLVDPNSTWTVERADIVSKAGWSPFEGHTFRGRTIATYLRGEEIAANGKCHDLRSGKFLHGAGGAGNG